MILLGSILVTAMAARHAHARRTFYIERPKLGIGLSYEFEEEKRTGPHGNTKNTVHDMREKLAIEAGGWVYHPALLKYTLRFEPEFSQLDEETVTEQENVTNRDSGSRNLFLAGYFAEATIFQFKPYTFHLFGQKNTAPTQSALAKRSETETDRYGADLSLKYKIRTDLDYTHLRSSQTGFYVSDEESDDFRLAMSHRIDKSDTRLNAVYNDNRRTTQGVPINTQSTHADLQNYYNITGDRRFMLNSFLSYRRTESDLFENTGLRLSEYLDWKHRENLRSRYRIGYDRNTSGDFENQTTTLGASVTHLLYENLTTTAAADASLNDFANGSEQKYGGHLDVDYRRSIPWGMLNLFTGFDYEMTHRSLTPSLIQVINESHVLKTGELTLLDHENVDIDSIHVTDTTGRIVYVEGIDYNITTIDSFVRITRIPFGHITDGQTVLVSYQYFSNPPFDDTLFGRSYGASVNLWSALTLLYSYNHVKQDVVSGTPPENLADDTTHRAEIRLDWKWTDTRLTYEDVTRQSGISTTTWLAEEALTFRPTRRIFFRVSGRIGEREFKETGETEGLTGLRADIDYLPVRWCKLSLEGYQDRVSGETEKTTDTGISADLELSYRIWGFRIAYDFVDEKDDIVDDQRTRQYLLFELIRTLW